MKPGHLILAMSYAQEFIDRAKRLQKSYPKNNPDNDYFGCAESGAVRRTSLELSRTLAALRNPYRIGRDTK